METVQTKNCILNRQAIAQKMKRMALEVAEQNLDEKELIIAGINGNGEIVARILTEELNKIYSFKTQNISIQINKKVSTKPTVWITGASKGIGAAIAELLAEKGFAVAASARTPITSLHENIHPFVCDVQSPAEIAQCFQDICDRLGGVDVLITNAGVATFASLVDTTDEAADEMLGVNLKPARDMGMTTIKVVSGEQAIADLERATGLSLRYG